MHFRLASTGNQGDRIARAIMVGPHQNAATFRFYGELDVFLPTSGRGREQRYIFNGSPGIKDAIEAQGVPHPEVAFILANGEPVDFGYSLAPGDRVSVYPAFRSLPSPAAARNLSPDPHPLRFVLDVNLGKLARWFRLLGFDAIYRNDFDDAEVAAISAAERRVALTRDRRLLYHKQIVYGYWVRADDPNQQVVELMHRYDLQPHMRPFHRCTSCNGLIRPVAKEDILHLLEPKTKRYYQEFFQCADCEKIYWRGSHYDGLLQKLEGAVRGLRRRDQHERAG